MQFWYMSQIKLTLTGDRTCHCKNKPKPLRPHREEKKHLLCWVMEWTLSESSNKTVYFERYTYTKQGSEIPWASSFPEPLCPTWCVTLFIKPCTSDLYIYRETPFNCPCTCLLLQIQKFASCGFHFFLGSGNGFTTEITPASNQHICQVSCHHGFIAAL